MIKLIFSAFILALGAYLVGAFISLEYNIYNWTVGGRACFSIFVIFGILFVSIAENNSDKDSKND